MHGSQRLCLHLTPRAGCNALYLSNCPFKSHIIDLTLHTRQLKALFFSYPLPCPMLQLACIHDNIVQAEDHAVSLIWPHGMAHAVSTLHFEALIQGINIQMQRLCSDPEFHKPLKGRYTMLYMMFTASGVVACIAGAQTECDRAQATVGFSCYQLLTSPYSEPILLVAVKLSIAWLA